MFISFSSNAEQTIEQNIASQVKRSMPQAVNDLRRSVNINSGTMNFDGVKQVGDLFGSMLAELNFETQWIDGSPFNRAGHLVATHLSENSSSTNLLLIGHLDTVFSQSDEFQKTERIDASHLAGPGITDMKGGNIIIVYALRSLKELGLLENMNIKVVMTGDEESSGRPLSKSKRALREAAEWADIALGFEDGDSNIETAVIARRGAVSWSLDVIGMPAHSSKIFQADVGYGAIFETARILNEFREQLAGVGNLTFNPGMILGGTTLEHEVSTSSGNAFGKSNVIAQTAKVNGGLRASTADELESAKKVMQEIVSQSLPHTSAILNIDDGYPPLAPSEGNRKLLTMYSDVSESLGYGTIRAVDPRNAGAADISFTAGLVDMALDGLGLMGSGGHTKDEVADMSSLLKNTQKAAILLYRLSEG